MRLGSRLSLRETTPSPARVSRVLRSWRRSRQPSPFLQIKKSLTGILLSLNEVLQALQDISCISPCLRPLRRLSESVPRSLLPERSSAGGVDEPPPSSSFELETLPETLRVGRRVALGTPHGVLAGRPRGRWPARLRATATMVSRGQVKHGLGGSDRGPIGWRLERIQRDEADWKEEYSWISWYL